MYNIQTSPDMSLPPNMFLPPDITGALNMPNESAKAPPPRPPPNSKSSKRRQSGAWADRMEGHVRAPPQSQHRQPLVQPSTDEKGVNEGLQLLSKLNGGPAKFLKGVVYGGGTLLLGFWADLSIEGKLVVFIVTGATVYYGVRRLSRLWNSVTSLPRTILSTICDAFWWVLGWPKSSAEPHGPREYVKHAWQVPELIKKSLEAHDLSSLENIMVQGQAHLKCLATQISGMELDGALDLSNALYQLSQQTGEVADCVRKMNTQLPILLREYEQSISKVSRMLEEQIARNTGIGGFIRRLMGRLIGASKNDEWESLVHDHLTFVNESLRRPVELVDECSKLLAARESTDWGLSKKVHKEFLQTRETRKSFWVPSLSQAGRKAKMDDGVLTNSEVLWSAEWNNQVADATGSFKQVKTILDTLQMGLDLDAHQQHSFEVQLVQLQGMLSALEMLAKKVTMPEK